jgi:hypothetical protein
MFSATYNGIECGIEVYHDDKGKLREKHFVMMPQKKKKSRPRKIQTCDRLVVFDRSNQMSLMEME